VLPRQSSGKWRLEGLEGGFGAVEIEALEGCDQPCVGLGAGA
jgi:hypothetical protein